MENFKRNLQTFIVVLIIGGIALSFGWYNGVKQCEQRLEQQEVEHWKQETHKMHKDGMQRTVTVQPMPRYETLEIQTTTGEIKTYDYLNVVPYFPRDEILKIFDAAERNNMPNNLIPILFAIRKAENGGPGNEFGIRCKDHRDTDFDQQAGCCAVTIINNYGRWIDHTEDFITFLGGNYCPTEGDDLTAEEIELNKHWIPDVDKWAHKILVKDIPKER